MLTMADTSSGEGPLGPGLRRLIDVNNERYLRFTKALWNLNIVEGFSTIEDRINRVGRINMEANPANILSAGCRAGALVRERLSISS
ncbi:hypothetical protein N9850_06185 [Granulosicoccus sp.]|nr:hypothetical protein [Granulosicoccus sp.]MDB4223342.1 hypothetical protein [Granulosicoccus sp.]